MGNLEKGAGVRSRSRQDWPLKRKTFQGTHKPSIHLAGGFLTSFSATMADRTFFCRTPIVVTFTCSFFCFKKTAASDTGFEKRCGDAIHKILSINIVDKKSRRFNSSHDFVSLNFCYTASDERTDHHAIICARFVRSDQPSGMVAACIRRRATLPL
jgi:hypothetical protein